MIVFNQCSDRTPEIVQEFANKEPDRVKAFHYLPPVAPPAPSRHRSLSPRHVRSFVHYSNFALSKASYRVCTKWDGDMIAAPDALKRVLNDLVSLKPWTLSWCLSPWKMGYWWFCGVNLLDRDGKLMITKTLPVSGGRKDIGFWPVGKRNIFRHCPRYEYLRTWWFKPSFVGFIYFHLKGIKRDRGLDTIYQDRDTDPLVVERMNRIWNNPDIITFEEFCRNEPAARDLPHPESLGIQPFQKH
ncbi:MAG: hypothetical protein JXA42_02190 [Anaerolineales bacterium]|nr:hypothetical protein [Anaerolineales bacterium]